MTHDPISREQIEHWLACYGANLERWPADIRAAMKHALETSPELERAFEAAAHLDHTLGEWSAEPAPQHLRARLAEFPLRHPQSGRDRLWPFRTIWKPALALAAAAVLGIAAGWQSPLPPAEIADEPATDEVFAEELSAVAFASHLTAEELP